MNVRVHVTASTHSRQRGVTALKTQKPVFCPPAHSPVDQILHLQRTIGNRAVQRLIKSGAIQKTKQLNDRYQHVANRVIAPVMRMPNSLVSTNVKGMRILQNVHALSNPVIQRESAQRICGAQKLKVAAPVITSSVSGGKRTIHLGPFSGILGTCQIKQGSLLIPSSKAQVYYQNLRKAVQFSRKVIKKIKDYIKSVPSTTKYEHFITWLHRITGVKPSKRGAKPSAAVAAETTAFIDPDLIISEWKKLGHFDPSKFKQNDPFDKWATMLHEQHHKKTILSYPKISQAYNKIRHAKKTLLSDKNMMAPYDKNLRSKADKEIPEHISDERLTIEQDHKSTWREINKKSAGRLQVVRDIDKLLGLKSLPNRKEIERLVKKYKQLKQLENAYYAQELALEKSLKQYYQGYEKWFEQARNFASEDLSAYCLSWKAEKEAITFIKRCCPRITQRQ
jgi:hypothetical protein